MAVVSAVALRRGLPEDAAEIAAIWNWEVRFTDATTDTEVRDVAAQRAWLAGRGDGHPVVVAVAGDEVVGFGALSPYRPKPAFRRSAEDSVYVKRGHRGAGIGSLILGDLVRLAIERCHRTVLARITTGNAASIRLHERHGFRLVGVERGTAEKHGRGLDVALMQLLL